MNELPVPVEEVAIPDNFSPSQWVQVEACPLSVWAEKVADLPESIEMIVGRLLHDVRARYTSRPEETRDDDVSALLGRLVGKYEENLRANPRTVSLTPLVHVFGQRKWLDAEIQLRRWARTAVRQPGREAEPTPRHPSGSASSIGETPLGAERTWSVPTLRLNGRPDLARLAADGAIEIIDYKSGSVFDRDGVHQSIVTQLQLYALMASTVTRKDVRLFVHAKGRIPIEWNDIEKAKLLQRVESLSSKYKAGIVLPANEASNPGTHCIACRLRPQCHRYLREIPNFWANVGDNPRPLPMDVWGVVHDQTRDAKGWTLHLADPSGRQVLISGIDERHGVHEGRLGRQIYAFALAAGEDRFMHGRSLHPRAFHEHSASPRWGSSICPSFYGIAFTRTETQRSADSSHVQHGNEPI